MLQGQQRGLCVCVCGGGSFRDKWVGVWLSRPSEEKIDYSICLEIRPAADPHPGGLLQLWSHGSGQSLKYGPAAPRKTPVISCP